VATSFRFLQDNLFTPPPLGSLSRRQLLRPRASILSLYLVGPIRQALSRCPMRPSSLSAPWTLPVSFALPALAVDLRVRTRARHRISRPRCPPTRPAPFLEPRQCPHSLPHLISHSSALSRALPTPPNAVGDPRPLPRPSSSPETAPSLPELHPKVRHLCPCLISLVSLSARPILASPVLGRGGPPCSRGGQPI
jgi:hypothetical protein